MIELDLVSAVNESLCCLVSCSLDLVIVGGVLDDAEDRLEIVLEVPIIHCSLIVPDVLEPLHEDMQLNCFYKKIKEPTVSKNDKHKMDLNCQKG